MNYYPPSIKDETILTMNIVVQGIKKDPQYLDDPTCPFSDTVKDFFREFSNGGLDADIFEGNDEVLVLEQQIQKTLNSLEAMAAQLGSMEPNERLNYYKTKTSLLEKLISMQERVYNLKEVADFRNTIIGRLEAICTKDQITDFMKSLDGTLGVEVVA